MRSNSHRGTPDDEFPQTSFDAEEGASFTNDFSLHRSEDITLFRRSAAESRLGKRNDHRSLRNAGQFMINSRSACLLEQENRDDSESLLGVRGAKIYKENDTFSNYSTLHGHHNLFPSKNNSPLSRPQAPLKKLPGVYYSKASRSSINVEKSLQESWSLSRLQNQHHGYLQHNGNQSGSPSSASNNSMDDFWNLFD